MGEGLNPSAEEMGLEVDEETGAGIMRVGKKKIEMTPPPKTEEEKAAMEAEHEQVEKDKVHNRFKNVEFNRSEEKK